MRTPVKWAVGLFGYRFLNSDAETYFDSLESAGFTEAQSKSLYSLNYNEIKEVIDNYFISITSSGIDILQKAMYLFIGGTAATHAINAINPGTFDLTFINSPTQSATGTAWNGTSQYAKTGIVPSVDLLTNNFHISYYSRTNVSESKVEIGCSQGASKRLMLRVTHSSLGSMLYAYNNTGTTGRVNKTGLGSLGLFSGNRVLPNEERIDLDGVNKVMKNQTGGTVPTIELYLAVFNNGGSPSQYSTKECAYTSIGDGLTTAEESDHYTAVQQLQTDLSRQV